MKEGECWFLDTRKPHRAINAGNEERIHLVVDVLVNERIQELLCKA
jgi:aspartyl/asparaginyl beta-hydroxylase (cupin superfamily)